MNWVIRGVGMLEATRSLLVPYDEGIAAITAGITRCAPDHPIVKANALAFAAADPDDLETRQVHTDLIIKRLAEQDGE